MKLYCPLTQQLTLAAFKETDEKGTPMLSDSAGAVLYLKLEDCIEASIGLSESLEVTAPTAAVIHIEFPNALHRDFIEQGNLAKPSDEESLDSPIVFLSAAACAHLNAEASFTASFHKLNPVIKNTSTA